MKAKFQSRRTPKDDLVTGVCELNTKSIASAYADIQHTSMTARCQN
jgi:hypothetical protein